MDLAIPTVELPPSFDIESQLSVWRTVLLSHLSDDNVIRKLWCLSPLMQELLTKYLTNLTCHVRAAVEPDQRYAHPSFLPQLTAVKNIRILRSRIDRLNYCQQRENAFLLPRILWSNFPDSVNTIHIGSGKLLGGNENRLTLLTLTCERKGLVVKFEDGNIPWEFREYAFNQVISSSSTLPYSHVSYLTSLERTECKELQTIWSKFPEEVVDWLMIYWVPLVEKLFLEEPSDPKLEQWCYDLFPNIHTIDGMATTLPVSIKMHSQNNTYNIHESPEVGSHTHPYLNNMDISVRSPPRLFPASLHTLHVLLDGNMSYKSLAVQVVVLLPQTLTNLIIMVGNGNRNDAMSIWELDVVAALPRGLKTLHTSHFPADIQHWKALPPQLTDLNVNEHFMFEQQYRKGLDTYTDLNYQVISPHLNSLNTCLSNSEHSVDIALLMPDLCAQITAITLSRFQSLVDLVLHINHPDVVKDGIPGLPLSIESFKLIINFELPMDNQKLDFMSTVKLPSQLRRLWITSSGNYHANFQQWQVFPDSLHVIEFYNMTIKSLPLIWPQQLRYLVLGNCSGPVHSLSAFLSQISPSPADKVLSIPDIAISLSTIPHHCIINITKGRIRYQEQYLIVDRITHTITVRDPVSK